MTLNLIITTIKLSNRFCNNKANFSCFYGTYFGKYAQAQPLSLMLNMRQAAVEVFYLGNAQYHKHKLQKNINTYNNSENGCVPVFSKQNRHSSLSCLSAFITNHCSRFKFHTDK